MSPRVHRLAALLAVLQVILLTSSLLLTPALVIAQDAEADASAQPVAAEPSPAPEPEVAAEEPAPAAEVQASEPAPAPADPPNVQPEPQAAPAQEAAPEPTTQEPAPEPRAQGPKSDKEQKPDTAPDREPGAEPTAEQAPVEPAPDVAPAEPERKLVIDSQPRKLDLVVGDVAKLSAWLCTTSGDGAGPGSDQEPGQSDACSPATDVRWSVRDEGVASFEAPDANDVRLAAVAVIGATEVVATLDKLTAKAELTISAARSAAANDAVAQREQGGATAGKSVFDATPHEAPAADMGAAAESTTDAVGQPTAQVGPADDMSVSASKMAAEDLIITPQSNVTITGSVATYPTGTPLIAGATVTATCTGCNNSPTVSYTGGGTSTNATGGFSVSVTYPGRGPATVTLTASAPGYSSVPQSSDTRTCTDKGSSCTASPVTLLLDPALRADLSVTKTDSPDPVIAGANLTYTITVANAGPNAAQSVSLTDTLPAGTTFVSLTAPAGFSCTTPAVGGNGTVTCTIASLAAGATQTFTLIVQVGASVAAGTVISNTATVSAATSDPNAANDSATTTTTVATSADLSVTKSDGVTTVTAGDGLTRTFTITVRNAGPSTATGVSLSDTWPAGFTRTSLPAACTDVGGGPSFDCALGPILAGATTTLVVTYTVPASTPAGPQANTATVSSSTTDPTPANNTATDTTTVATSADLSVTKTDSPDPVIAGANLTYTITVANAGPNAAQSVSLTDTLPAGTTFVSLTAPAGFSCTTPAVGGNGTVTCTIASLAAGATQTFTLIVQVGASVAAGTVISNTATVSAATSDPNAANDSATTTTTVATSADLSVTEAGDRPGRHDAERRPDARHGGRDHSRSARDVHPAGDEQRAVGGAERDRHRPAGQRPGDARALRQRTGRVDL